MNAPVICVRDKALSIALFETTSARNKKFYATMLQRRYKKKGEDEWQVENIHIFPNDLVRFRRLIDSTLEEIKKNPEILECYYSFEKDYKENKETPSPL